MSTRLPVTFIILLFLAACSPQPTPIPGFVGAEEYVVYRDVLIDNPEMWNIPPGTQNVVFFDHTFLRHDPDSVRAILQRTDGVSEELIASFLEANKQPYPLEAQFDLGKPVMLVPREEIRNLVQGLAYAEQCYHTMRAVYPAPEYGGWYYVSRVGFDARMKTALVYIEQSLCGGAGNFLVLTKVSGVWKIKAWAVGLQKDMRLVSPAEISAEEYAVYNALLTASKEFSLGSGYQYITVYDQTGLSEGLTRPGEDLYAAIRQKMPAVIKELVDNLVAVNTEPYDLAPRFAFEVPVVLVSWREYETLSKELEEQKCFETVRERFPHPEFQGWFRLSRVGFNQSMDQALVYVESYVCNGAGFIVLMEKHSDIWKMTAYTLVWVS